MEEKTPVNSIPAGAIQGVRRSHLLEERNATSDIGRLAIVISEAQRDLMELGKHMSLVMQRVETIDRAAGQRLSNLEGALKQLIEKEQADTPAAPNVIDLRSKVEDKPAEL